MKVLIAILFSLLPLLPFASYAADNTNYITPSLQNLSKAYWALGMLNADNPDDLDHYLLINECDIFKRYSGDDFEWQKIRGATKDLMQTKGKSFPLTFRFIQPLNIGKYDFQKQSFPVDEEDQIIGTRKFFFLSQRVQEDICAQDIDSIPRYPKAILAELNRPITIKEIKVPVHIADAYIKLQQDHRRRETYLAFDVTLKAHKANSKTDNDIEFANILGDIDSIQVYGDRKFELLLYKNDFEKTVSKTNLEQEYNSLRNK